MEKICEKCEAKFFITEDDEKFLDKIALVINGKKISIPVPKLCPDCRQQRLLVLRNERALYHRKCDMCNASIISMFPADCRIKVYCKKCWWSDKWNPLDCGKEFDFKKPFFEQFNELVEEVPFAHLIAGGEVENCDYTNYLMTSKNCYLVSSSDYDEDCYYSTYIFRSKNCFDCLFVNDSELLYECVDSNNCYASAFLQDCQNVSDSYLCYDCKSCQNCIGCVGLRNKQYHIMNEKYSKEEYEKKKAGFFGENRNLEILREQFNEFKLKFPHKFAEITGCVDSYGDKLSNCKSAHNCFDLVEARDCKNVALGLKAKDCHDCVGVPNSELCYCSTASPEDYSIHFSAVTWPRSDFLQYCLFCRMSKNSFGCVALHKNEYCILNKQYTKQEYEELLPKIIEYMKKTEEYGEFFPIEISPFSYNETVAQDYFPLTKEEVLVAGWKWHEDESEKMYKGPKVDLPENIDEVTEDICKKILTCEITGKPYRIIPQELMFYKKTGMPIPKKCPDQRHVDRMKLRNPRKLWDRKCEKCSKSVKTSYDSSRPELVYCEECYLAQTY